MGLQQDTVGQLLNGVPSITNRMETRITVADGQTLSAVFCKQIITRGVNEFAGWGDCFVIALCAMTSKCCVTPVQAPAAEMSIAKPIIRPRD